MTDNIAQSYMKAGESIYRHNLYVHLIISKRRREHRCISLSREGLLLL